MIDETWRQRSSPMYYLSRVQSWWLVEIKNILAMLLVWIFLLRLCHIIRYGHWASGENSSTRSTGNIRADRRATTILTNVIQPQLLSYFGLSHSWYAAERSPGQCMSQYRMSVRPGVERLRSKASEHRNVKFWRYTSLSTSLNILSPFSKVCQRRRNLLCDENTRFIHLDFLSWYEMNAIRNLRTLLNPTRLL